MTLDEFFVKLEEIKNAFDWSYRSALFSIRGANKYTGVDYFCPLNAVNYCINNEFLQSHMLFPLANSLKMDVQDCMYIMMASDSEKAVSAIRDKLKQILFGPANE